MEVHVFGPVPSRRLGMSLGVDLIPVKTCSFNCVYCQVGRTTVHTARRRTFVDSERVLRQVRSALRKKRRVDYVTFSGSGEPTLAANIGHLIRSVKDLTGTPVAVITNSSLMSRTAVRRDLMAADLVVPSLDAARQEAFRKVNRPVRGIKVSEIVQGLTAFREKFRGQMWLEVMLVRGINDSLEEIAALRKAIAQIGPDRIQLNTVVRPPCERYAAPISQITLKRIARKIAEDIPVEIIVPFKGKMSGHVRATRDEVLAMIQRRSCTIEDISVALGINRAEAIKHAEYLASTGQAQTHRHRDQLYYLATSKTA